MMETGRHRVALAVALTAVGTGLLLENAAIFLSSIVAFCYAGYGFVARPPTPDLAVERTVDPASPSPGDAVSVRVRVTNEGTDVVPDLRIADEPPAALEVVDGSRRAGATLAPGDSVTLEYVLRARRGEHAFGDVVVSSRNVSGALAAGERFEIEHAFDPDDALERMPLQGQTIQHAGRVETDVGGEGLEFYSTRSYQPTDPMSRVDWKRLARTGELTTVEFREERAASVVVLVDERWPNHVVRRDGEPNGIDLSRHAAEWIAEALLSANNRVGVAQYGGSGHYLLPRSDRGQSARIRRLFEGEWSDSFGRRRWLSKGDDQLERFCRELADEKQIVFVSALLDDEPVDSVRRFRAFGHAVTVVCPTIADADTIGGRIERIDNAERASTLREHGVRVVEWSPDDPLHVAIDGAKRRWSA